MRHASNLESVNPDLTAEVMTQVDEIIDRNKGKPGCLIPVLEECQGVVGYLPVELQEYIGSLLNIPGSTIYGVDLLFFLFHGAQGQVYHQGLYGYGMLCVGYRRGPGSYQIHI